MIEKRVPYEFINLQTAMWAVDQVLTEGRHLKRDLRWRVSLAQRTAILQFGLMLCANPSVAREIELGSVDSGVFCGIPFYVDPKLDDDKIILEAALLWEGVVSLEGLTLPRVYEEAKSAVKTATE